MNKQGPSLVQPTVEKATIQISADLLRALRSPDVDTRQGVVKLLYDGLRSPADMERRIMSRALLNIIEDAAMSFLNLWNDNGQLKLMLNEATVALQNEDVNSAAKITQSLLDEIFTTITLVNTDLEVLKLVFGTFSSELDELQRKAGQRSTTISRSLEKIITLFPNLYKPITGMSRILGQALVDEGKWHDGLRLLESGLKISRYDSDLNARADIIFQIGRTHHLIGNYDKARMHYRDALRLYEHMGNQSGIADCKSGLGHLMTQMGYVDEAVDNLKSAKRLYRKLGNQREVNKVDQVLKLAEKVKEKQLT